MENASKALLMAAGMLLVMLILALVIFAWGKFSDYQNAKDSLVDIEDTAKFNEQFTHYDRDDVQGYEILSLINKVVDYNERKSDVSKNNNNEKYNPINLIINLGFTESNSPFSYNNTAYLFKSDIIANAKYSVVNYKKNSDDYSLKNKIETTINGLGNVGITESEANNMAKSISSIFLTDDEITAKAQALMSKNNQNQDIEKCKKIVKSEMIKKYNSFTTTKITDAEINKLIIKKNSNGNVIDCSDVYKKVCAYYEYIQFKRGVFKCTKLTYDQPTGRVSSMEFTFSGKIY